MGRKHAIMDSPIGPLTLVASEDGLCGLWMDTTRGRPLQETFGEQDSAPFGDTVRQLEEYFAGNRTEFDLTLAMEGTPFQCGVWQALREIPYGQTISYGELAEMINRPTAARAVGMANGRNPISIIVPCHRVIGASGSLTGYGGGLDRKRILLDLEGQHLFSAQSR